MKKLFVLFLGCLGGGLFGQPAHPYLDSLLRAEVAQRQFSGVVWLAAEGLPVYQAAVGQATDSARMTLDTRFRLASITKAFTAVLVMQLVEAGRLTPESTIAEVLPSLPVKRAKRTTVQDLLLHRSGLPNEPDALYQAPRDARAMIVETVATEPYHRYGRFNYCNLDYLVLGLMIEQLTGKRWATVLQERILTPLGMDQTGLATRLSPGLAQGYLVDGAGKLQPEPAFHIENIGAAGAMVGTARDLLLFDQSLYTERLLQPETTAAMYTSHPELGYVAYGSWVYDYYFLPSSPRLVERRGGILGFNHAFIRMPEINKTLIILSNNDRFDPDTFGQLDSFKDRLIKALVEGKEGK
jgi:CubicO group peptidase (beta-lactamase class C family)